MPRKQKAAGSLLTPYSDVDNWMQLDYHEYCTIFPPMTDEEYDSLVGSMQEHGFYESDPIVLIAANDDPDDDTMSILDGRNRALAAADAGVVPQFMRYNGDDPLGFVTARNIDRRHLTTGQKAAVASKIATLTSGQTTAVGGTSRSEAANAVGTTETAVKRFRAVQAADPALAAAVESGAVTLNQAYTSVSDAAKKNAEAEKERNAPALGTPEDQDHEAARQDMAPQESEDDVEHDGEKAPPGSSGGQRPVKATIDRGPFNTEFEQKHPVMVSGLGKSILRLSVPEARVLRDWLDTAIGKYEKGDGA